MPDQSTCAHQWGGNHHDNTTDYSCGLCGATGHYDPDQGAVVADVPPAAPAADPAPAPASE